MRLAGKVALITGAAAGIEGQLMGFGGAAARLFAREGARVVVTDIKEEMGFQTAEQIRAHGGEWIVLAKGNLIGIGKKDKLNELVLRARSKYPDGIPFIAPIPTKDELECVL